MTVEAPSFSPELFAFLRELAANNDREWFTAHKARYVAEVQEPALAFIEDVGLRLPEVSRHLVADPRTVGGSMFRIHRDVRFSKDKSPYKTHVGIQFRHERARDAHAPGVYLHLIDEIERKDFIAIADLTESEATTSGFLDRFLGLCSEAGGFIRLLCDSARVPF